MPIEILAGLVVGGISFAAFMVWWLVNSKPDLIESENIAHEIFKFDYPEVVIAEIIRASDQHSALLGLKSPSDCTGMITVMGSKHVTRLLNKGDIKSYKLNGNDLILHLNDFTIPKVSLNFASSVDLQKAAKWLSKLDSIPAAKQVDANT